VEFVSWADLPASAAWRHQGARSGFEVAFFSAPRPPLLISGCTTAVEATEVWAIFYDIELDSSWHTRTAHISGRSARGMYRRVLEADGDGHWRIDGIPAAHFDGCLDVDLESSAMTNTLPVHREQLQLGHEVFAPATYVRAADLGIERLEQSYRRLPNDGGNQCFDYQSPAFDFRERLVFDPAGLVINYPGIAVRVK
jgi:uncharacterized protein